MQKQRGSKVKEKVDETIKVTKIYSTRSAKKKLMGDAIKANKSTTTKRRRLNKVTMTEK